MKNRRFGVGLAVFLLGFLGSARAQVCTAPNDAPVDGSRNACTDFRVRLLDLGPIEPEFDITDEGWVRVSRSYAGFPRYVCASGVVESANIASNDTPANHDSHDMNFDLKLDLGQRGLLSNVNPPNNSDFDDDTQPGEGSEPVEPEEIEVEWETGIRPDEHSGDGENPIFPKWAWPSIGDRAWVNGNWVFDCGHGKKIGHYELLPGPNSIPYFVGAEYFRSEIHPPRAVAAMRRQVGTIPGSGATPVPVIATDLYMHGRGGFVTDILNCGMSIILDGVDEDGDGDGDGDPDACPQKTTPLAEDFTFEVCLPPRPHAAAKLSWIVETGPGDTFGAVAPEIETMTASPSCANDGDPTARLYDMNTSLRVTLPLAGSGILPTDVYARRIRAGWVFPDAQLRHLTVALRQMDLHDDHDDVPGDDGELTFFWMNLNASPDEWARLSDHDVPTYDSCSVVCPDHTNTLEDYDDDGACCNGLLNFSGPNHDFYVAGGRPFVIRSRGWDQDCYDFGNFGNHNFGLGLYADCHVVDIDEYGGNDALGPLPSKLAGFEESTTFGPPDYGVGVRTISSWRQIHLPGEPQPILSSEYDWKLEIAETPLADEVAADLHVEKGCRFAGEVALPGRPVQCSIVATNEGPGLSASTRVVDQLTGPGAFTMGPARLAIPTTDGVDCPSTAPGSFTCEPGTIPIGTLATVDVAVTPQAAGIYRNTATVSAGTTDGDPSDDRSTAEFEVFLPISIDISPGSATNPIEVKKQGTVGVAILTTSTFNAASVNVSTLCFGDSGAPAERTCVEIHGKGHPQDVDKDGDLDLLLHYDQPRTGIDVGDVEACLRGRTTAGIGVFGCDVVTAQ